MVESEKGPPNEPSTHHRYKYHYPKGVPTKVSFTLMKPEEEEEIQTNIQKNIRQRYLQVVPKYQVLAKYVYMCTKGYVIDLICY